MNATFEFVSRVSRVFARIGGMLILLTAILVSLDVFFRNVFQWTAFESYELATYGIALAITFGFAWALVSKAHIRIEVIYNVLPLKPRGWLDVFALGVLAVVVVALTYWALQVVLDSVEMGSRSNSSLAIPMAWPQGLWLIGLVWFSVCSVALFGVALWGVCTKRFAEVQARFGLASVEEEIELGVDHLAPAAPAPQPGAAARVAGGNGSC